jgi:hypothetical protein
MTADAADVSPLSDPDVLGDVVARHRRAPSLALRADGPGRTYSYHDFVTTTYKAGNVLRYLGVREGDVVAVEPDRLPEPVLTFYGAAQLGAVVRFAAAPDDVGDARAVVAPVDREGEYDLPPGSNLAVYGGPPDGPSTTHWEKEVWSENPAVHPTDVSPSDPVLRAEGRTYAHADLLAAAARVVETADVAPGDEVVVRGPLSSPGVVAAGLVAPLVAGAAVVFSAGDAVCDVSVGDGPESRVVDPAAVWTDG